MIARLAWERRRLQRCGLGLRSWRGECSSPWRLRQLRVCASTETELERWLQRLLPDPGAPLAGPLALVACSQTAGRGQRGRAWSSPPGGVWLSAALPWPGDPADRAAPALAVAVGLALQLERLQLPVRIKWPNDIVLLEPDGSWRKLAGVLPRLRLRAGCCRWLQVGVGLNGRNPVPPGAVNLRRFLGWSRADPAALAARVLLGLEWAMAHGSDPALVRRQARQRLLVASDLLLQEGGGWRLQDLTLDGALVLERGGQRRELRRCFTGDAPEAVPE